MENSETYLRTVGEKVLEIAKKKNMEAEVYFSHQRELSIEVVEQRVDTLVEAEELGLGLRVYNNGRVGFAYTSDLAPAAVRGAVNDAINIAKYTGYDDFNTLPYGDYDYPRLDLYDSEIVREDMESKIERARQMEIAAREVDSRIRIVEKSGYEDTDYSVLVMNTRGVCAFSRANYCGLYISLVAEDDNGAQDGFSFSMQRKINDLHSVAVGEEAAVKALRSMGARAGKSDTLPCIIEPYIVTRFMGLIAKMADAGSVQKGKSMLAGKLGSQIASPLLNLLDHGAYPGGIGSFPFDAEGISCRKNVVLENGVLKGYLYDAYTAGREGRQSTGNAGRASFRSLPSVSTTNLLLLPGDKTRQQLIGEIEYGFYITEIMGLHTANPISGDFSLGAAGLMIEKGSLSYPVRGVTIAGNLVDLLKRVEAVGNDIRFFGSKAAPSLLLNSISIGGD